jgi:hypothetical protein
LNRSEVGKGVDVMVQGRVDWYSANLSHGFIRACLVIHEANQTMSAAMTTMAR